MEENKTPQRGRKNVYYDRILPNMDKIESQIRNGATELQVAKNIGVSRAAWNKHKKEQEYFRNRIRTSRESLVQELRGKLIEKAMGFEYVEVEETTKVGDKGTEKITKRITKQSLPDVAALNLALKNYDPDNWANDPQYLKIKKEELEMKKEALKNEW